MLKYDDTNKTKRRGIEVDFLKEETSDTTMLQN